MATTPRWMCTALRLLVQAILLAVLWYNFGHESWQKYRDDKVLVTTEERLEERPRMPAVTICPYSSTNLNPDTANHRVETLCKDKEDIAGCIQDESGNLTSAVVSATRGFGGDNLLDTNLWLEDITAVFLKKCFTLNTTARMENDFVLGSLVVKLNKSLNQFVFVHDLNFFVPGLNPFSMPKSVLLVEASHGSMYYKMRKVVRVNLPHAGKECRADPGYSFTLCVKVPIPFPFNTQLLDFLTSCTIDHTNSGCIFSLPTCPPGVPGEAGGLPPALGPLDQPAGPGLHFHRPVQVRPNYRPKKLLWFQGL